MSASTTQSLLILIAVGCATLLVCHMLMARVKSRFIISLFILFWLIGGFTSIWLLDINIPLHQSHIRPDGDPAPIWLALLAWTFRIGLVGGIPISFARLRKLRSTESINA